jgi:hypothetical protein
MTDEWKLPEDLDRRVGELLAAASQRAETLRSQAEEADRVRSVWADLQAHIDKGWLLHVVADLDRGEFLVERTMAADPGFQQTVAEARRIADEYARRLPHRFPALLEQAAREADLPIDRESRHPRYEFDQGFFRVDVDDRKGRARLSDREGVIAEIPADVDAVVDAIKRERKRVLERAFDPGKFLRKLRSNYLAILQRDKLQDGSPIPIRQVTRRLGKNEKGFRTDEFLVDMSRLIQQGPVEVDGWRLELQHTKDTGQGMLLHGAASSGYIGFITFRKV